MTAASRPSANPRSKRTTPAKPRLQLVDRSRSNRRSTPKLRTSLAGTVGTLAVVLVMLLAFGAVAVQTLQIQQRLGIQATTKAADEARGVQAALQLDVARLEAPARILAEAQARLGMIPPVDRPFLAAHPPGDLERPIDTPMEGMFADPTAIDADAAGSEADDTAGGENE